MATMRWSFFLLSVSLMLSRNSVAALPVQPGAKLENRLPEAIIIGVKKGGTRALLEYLRLNPLVKAPGPEVHFFDRHYDRGIEWYRKQMPTVTREQLLIEKTPSYFVTKTAPERIFEMNPKVKLVVVVRDPVTRAISDYTQTASKRPGMPPFEAMAFNSTTGQVNKSWGAVKIGIYERHLKRWRHYFPLDQMHFVSGEKLISDPASELEQVQEFLGLPSLIAADRFVYNPEKGFPCLVKQVQSVDSDSGVQKLTKKLHCLGKTKGRTHPHLSQDSIDRLRTFFEPHNRIFYKMVGRNFNWS